MSEIPNSMTPKGSVDLFAWSMHCCMCYQRIPILTVGHVSQLGSQIILFLHYTILAAHNSYRTGLGACPVGLP